MRRADRLSLPAARRGAAIDDGGGGGGAQGLPPGGGPVVPRGAGTSLAGGSLPTADCVLLGVARMNGSIRHQSDALSRGPSLWER